MPRSKARKRNGAKVVRRSSPRATLVAQRGIADLVDTLDALMREVPSSYNPTNLAEVVEHHHHAAAVVDFIRTQRVVDLLARLGGGDMIVMPDEEEQTGTPTQEANIVQSPSSDPVPLDNQAMTWWVSIRRHGVEYHVPGGEGPDWPGPSHENMGSATVCGRSMRTGSMLDAGELDELEAKPCPRCAALLTTPPGSAFVEAVKAAVPTTGGALIGRPPDPNPWGVIRTVEAPRRIPGATLTEADRATPAPAPSDHFSTDTDTLERLRVGLGGKPEPHVRHAHAALTCPRCGRVVEFFTNGNTRRHKTPAGIQAGRASAHLFGVDEWCQRAERPAS